MKVNSINSTLGFKGSIGKTDKGNDYEKSYSGRTVFTIMALSDYVGEAASGSYRGSGIIVNLLLACLIGFGVGSIMDKYINKTRKKDVDSFIESKKPLAKTHKGKKLGAEIGAGVGAVFSLIGLVTNAFTKNIKLKKLPLLLLAIPFTALGGMLNGLVYDLSVNKYRKKLANQPVNTQV